MRSLLARSSALFVVLAACGDEPVTNGVDAGGDAASRFDADTVDAAPADGAAPEGGLPGAACAPLPAPPSNAVTVSNVATLRAALQNAAPNATILVADGTYTLGVDEYLYVAAPGVTLRGKSGDATKVIIDANYAQGLGQSILSIAASDVTVADLTLRRAYDHPIHVIPAFTNPKPISGVKIYRVHVEDPGQQGIKVNPEEPGFGNVQDGGTIACSRITLSAAGRAKIRDNCYTGGIDVHAARGWTIRDNWIEGFWCPSGLSEHAIHCWKGCRDTIVERNVMVNDARGVGLGLGDATAGRVYGDSPCPSVTNYGNVGGVVRNNFVVATDPALHASAAGFDVGIGLEKSCGGTNVVHNTVFSTQAPKGSAIEWRFAGTNPGVTNNLASHVLKARDGATATQAGNVANATAGMFVDPTQGDLHLQASATTAIDQGAPVGAGVCDGDVDGTQRPAARDVGADER
jgi:hypothetical protein